MMKRTSEAVALCLLLGALGAAAVTDPVAPNTVLPLASMACLSTKSVNVVFVHDGYNPFGSIQEVRDFVGNFAYGFLKRNTTKIGIASNTASILSLSDDLTTVRNAATALSTSGSPADPTNGIAAAITMLQNDALRVASPSQPQASYIVMIRNGYNPNVGDAAVTALRQAQASGIEVFVVNRAYTNYGLDANHLFPSPAWSQRAASTPIADHIFQGAWSYHDINDLAGGVATQLLSRILRANSISARSDNVGLGVCTLVGGSHVHVQSVDGAMFSFNGWGEYTLLQTRGPVPGWTVQARVLPCSQGSTQTCVRGVYAADDNGNSLEFTWKPRPNGGAPDFWVRSSAFGFRDASTYFSLDGSWMYGSLNNGHDVSIAAIGNTVDDNPGYLVEALFSTGGHIRLIVRNGFQSVSVRAPASLTSYTRGLCGVADQCLNNEWTTSGDVVTNDINTFSESWRLNTAQSRFYRSGSDYATYQFRNWAHGPAGESDRAECSGVSASPLLLAACRADGSTAASHYTEYVRMLCSSWLNFGKEYTSLLADPAGSCGKLGDPEGHTQNYLHSTYNTTVGLPNYQLDDDDQPTAFLRPRMNLGGTYGFIVTATDVCQTVTKYVNLNVKCSGTSAAPSVPVKVIELDRTLNVDYFPIVPLYADLLGGSSTGSPLFYSWQMTHYPPNSNSYIVRGVQTLVPLVYIDAYDPVPSEYWFEVAVSDGCAIHRETVIVRTRCSKCVPTARLDSSDSATLNASSNFVGGRVYNSINLDGSHSADADRSSLNMEYLLYKVSNSSFRWAVSNQTSGSTTNYDIYEVTSPRVDLGNSTMSESSSTPVTPGGTSSAPVVLTHAGGYTSPVLGATRYTTTSSWSMTHDTAVTSSVQLEQQSSKCTVSVTNNGDTATVSASEVDSDPWTAPLCLGTYRVRMDVSDDCRTASDIAEIGVECGGKLSAALQCPATVAYNYATSSFPTVNIDGTQTYDSHDRNLASLWTLTAPADSILTSGALSTTGTWTRALDLDQGGTYTVRLDVTNGCQQDFTTATIVGTCGNAITAGATASATTVTFPGANTVNLDGTTSLSNNVGSTIQYSWTVTPPAALATTVLPSDLASFEPSPLSSFAATFTSTMRFMGQYTYNLQVTDGCTTARTSVAVNFACTNTITLAPGINGGAATLTQAYDYATGFVTVTLAANPTYAGTTAQYRFMLSSWPSGSSATPSVIGFSTSSSVQFTADRFGEYTFRIDAQDGCYWTSDVSLKLTVTAPTLTAVIERDAAQPLIVGTPQYFSGILSRSTSSTSQPSLSYSWSIVQQPGSGAFFAQANSMNSTFYGSGSGNYVIRLAVTDGLVFGAYASADYSFTLLCPANPYTAGITTSTNSVAWSTAHGSFPLVELTGKNSNLNSLPAGNYEYEWRITAAPVGSVYAPTDVITVSNSSSVNIYNSANSLWQNSTTVVTNSSSYQETVSWVQLTTTVQTPDFAAVCFRPDVAGEYKLQFRFTDGCLPYTTPQIATITASCNAAPTIKKITPTQRLSLSFWTYQRLSVSVEASDSNEDPLWYKWSWVTHPSNLTEGNFITIADAHSAEASFIPQKPGNYTLKVAITDGCNVVEGFVTIITGCDSDPNRDVVENVNVAFDPFAQGPLSTTTFALTDDKERNCTLSYSWDLIAFTPDTLPFSAVVADEATLSGGAIAGIVIGAVAFVVIAAGVAFFCYRRRKAKGDNGGTEMGAR